LRWWCWCVGVDDVGSCDDGCGVGNCSYVVVVCVCVGVGVVVWGCVAGAGVGVQGSAGDVDVDESVVSCVVGVAGGTVG